MEQWTGHNWERVCQSCILSPWLFNLYVEYIMQNSRLDESKAAIKIARRNINNITYADLLLFISTTSEMQLLSQVPNFSSPWTAARQASLSFTSPRGCTNSNPLSQWCHPKTSSSVTLFSSCPQSFPASGSFQMSQHFASGSQSIGASVSVLMSIQGWFALGFTDLISLLSKGLSKVFSSTTVQKHQPP